MKKKQKPLSPMSLRDARTDKEICSLRYDNISTKHFWMLVTPGEVTLTRQTTGERAQVMVSMPRRIFNRFVDAYTKKQPRKRV